MNSVGCYEGIIIVSTNNEWCVYQRYPIDMGVFAFNYNILNKNTSCVIGDFLTQDRVKELLCSNKKDDLEIVKYYGRVFFQKLLMNYSGEYER